LDILGREIDARVYDERGGMQLLHNHFQDGSQLGPTLPPSIGGVSIIWTGANSTNLAGSFDGLSATRLERGDFDADGQTDVSDLDALSNAIATSQMDHRYDVNHDLAIDREDHRTWVEDVRRTWFGDANLDGRFDAGDIIMVLQGSEYDDGIAGNSSWMDGDWNADLEFDNHDLIFALQSNGYEQGLHAAVAAPVPEPSGAVLGWLSFGVWLLSGSRGRRAGRQTAWLFDWRTGFNRVPSA
jgi:hypothetical protein